ncbi:flagellar motor protein MotA [Methyloprofundus sedimenti]|uniref:Flagellar motor protein MotA n=1 Tax=Methyloprofundus sedimenti TaxID=1420851 RepID=A0A1V8M6H2_9GAMM|nr:MotA/TolQ/ExbB proton channel family protein [Methyloprofundus sedimenti]OQK17086.1 flagellar motor protein MotA [Methyloprofundus sedimenti]
MKKLLLFLTLLFISVAQSAEPTGTQATGVNTDGTPGPAAEAKKDPVGPVVEPIDLKTAYKREYAFLDAQKRELQKRLLNFKKKSASDERKLINKIDSLERGSVSRAEKIDQISAQLNTAEQNNTAGMERDEVLQMTYSQAEATLKKYNIETDTKVNYTLGTDEEKVSFLFDNALALVKSLGELRKTEGKFFLNSGKEVEGDLVLLGNIAAYGISKEGSGALVPAGADNLKLWRQPAQTTAIALDKNEQPEQLKIFLFESREKAIEETPEKTWLSVIESGGVIGWIIVCLGGFAAILIFVRIYLLYINSSDTQKLTEQITRLLYAGKMEKAKQICQTGHCAITRVMESTLRHIKDDRDHMEDIISEAILQESTVLNRFGTSILVIASVSPLLGLLGTVTGMISTFDIITEFGTGDPKLLSGGISIALVTTELGLIVAIPTLLFGSLLSAWSENIKLDMEVAALRITNTLLSATEQGKVVTDMIDSGGKNDYLLNTAQTS